MALSDFWRGRRDRSDRDDNRWQDSRNQSRSDFGRPNYAGDDYGFERRGWRSGSDYYGDDPRRFDQQRSRHSAEWGGSSQRFEEDRPRGNSAFNDRWQNSYGEGASSYGQRSDWSGDYGFEDRDRDEARWWNERSGQSGGDIYSAQSGQFRGRGPRGYRRSDERIREEVCECLTDDERIDATNVQVDVKDCEVTLSGSVNSREEKRRAEDLIERLSGVKDVHNTLRVVNEGGLIEGGGDRGTQNASQGGQASHGDQRDQASQTSRH
jgi:osmotically-inducible protein OsmY